MGRHPELRRHPPDQAGSLQRQCRNVRLDGLEVAVRRARQAARDDLDVLVVGADVARQLLRAGLPDEVRIHLVPLLLGAGRPLFAGERAELIRAGKPVTGTVTHLSYRVARP